MADDEIIPINEEEAKAGDKGMKESDNNSSIIDENTLDDEIEILVKVRQNGNLKTIVFQSNIFLFIN